MVCTTFLGGPGLCQTSPGLPTLPRLVPSSLRPRGSPDPVLRPLRRQSAIVGVFASQGGGRIGRRGLPATAAAAAAMADKGKVLITFDVDGTLMRSTGDRANHFHKKAFAFAFQSVSGIDASIDDIQHHGSTDPAILVDVLKHHGVPTETATAQLPELKEKMVEYAKQNTSRVGDGLQLLPGVASLLETLSKRQDVIVALVTGNLEDIGWLKMEALGIRRFFSTPNFGGFGSDHASRGELVKIAWSRAQQLFHGDISHRVHVGDTPNDILAAIFGGALPIGVCTGVFTRSELLEAAGSAEVVVLDDLKHSDIFLKACGLLGD